MSPPSFFGNETMAKHEMKSLKRTRSESKDDGALEKASEDFFPLSIYVGEPEIEKLGLSGVSVGEEHDLAARVKVTGVSVTESEGSKKRVSVTLTFLAGAVYSDHGESDEARGKKLYGGK